MNRRLVPLAIVLLTLSSLSPHALSRQSSESRSLVVLRGHVVCAQGVEGAAPDSGCKGEGNARFSFTTTAGKRYGFVPNDEEAAIFSDHRVRERDLQLTVKVHPGDRLELVKVQSIRQGKLYDLYFFCELCNITAYAPGLCPCCRNELEFRETEATDNLDFKF